MTRRKKDTIMYIKNGGGTFRLANGKIVKPGEKFNAHPNEIPQAFRDQVIALEDEAMLSGEGKNVKAPKYQKKEANLFYIFDSEKEEKVADKAYSEELADQIVEEGFVKVEKNGGWVDIVDPEQEAINSKSLRGEEVDKILSAELYKEKAELFHVLDAQRKQVNEQPLTDNEADEMIKELS